MVFEEKTIESEMIYRGAIFNLRKDRVTVLNGESTREIIEHNGGAVIVPVLDNGKVVMVKQYRKAADRFMLEIPAGKIDPGEKPEVTAVRELKEETGYTASEIIPLTVMYPTPGYSEERLYIYMAKGLTPGETDPDENEAIDIMEFSMEDAISMIMAGQIEDAKTQVGILMADRIIGK